MIELGKYQTLQVIRHSDFGVYLNTPTESDSPDILLPNKLIPEGTQIGDKLYVFVYKDTKDRLIATTEKPKVTLGEVAKLEVVEVTRIGAFLDWGLEKDLFMPFKEQLGKVKKGDLCFVSVYIDKSERLCATMKVYDHLSTNDGLYSQNQNVEGIIYAIKEDLGALVAVDYQYHGMIPVRELKFNPHSVGDLIKARIKNIRPDGKLELSLRKQAFQQIEEDAAKIMEALNKQNGELSLNDHSSPTEIKKALNISKAAFKRAIGRLLKEGAIEITSTGIKRTW